MQLTYLQFHAVFVVPVLLLLWYLAPKYGSVRRRRSAVGIVILVTIAFGYTTPWGSYMIRRGAWWYADGAVLLRGLSIPLGEYLFFVLKTVLVGLYLHLSGFDPTYRDGDFARAPRIAGSAVGVAMLVGGLYLVTLGDQYLYLGSLVAWVGPVVVIQWAVGGGYLVSSERRGRGSRRCSSPPRTSGSPTGSRSEWARGSSPISTRPALRCSDCRSRRCCFLPSRR